MKAKASTHISHMHKEMHRNDTQMLRSDTVASKNMHVLHMHEQTRNDAHILRASTDMSKESSIEGIYKEISIEV